MSGKIVVGIILGVTALFAAALIYFQLFAYYERVTRDRVTIAGQDIATDYQGYDATSSPLKVRGCFTLDALPDAPPAPEAAPLRTPFWIRCFDASEIQAALDAGTAQAVIAEANDPYGFDVVVARLEDGRAFLWRQRNACGTAHFRGFPLPPTCPLPPE